MPAFITVKLKGPQWGQTRHDHLPLELTRRRSRPVDSVVQEITIRMTARGQGW